jgi:hypothetical protein
MPTLPSASISIDDTAAPFGGGTDLICVLAPVATNDDGVPRLYTSAAALMSQHGYAPGADYAAMHVGENGKPFLFVGLPIATAGFVGSVDSSAVAGTSLISVAGGANGILDEVEGEITVTTGGTVGTIGIVLDLKLGRTTKSVRLGSASSYTIAHLGIVVSFGAGTLIAGDVFSFRTTGPRWGTAGIAAARVALAAQQKQFRSALVVGDCADSDEADAVLAEANTYASSNDRFIFVRASVPALRLAKMSKQKASFVGGTALTFAEVGASADTITRAGGSFLTDGFLTGYTIVVTGATTPQNNLTAKLATAIALVLTLGTEDLAAEVTSTAAIVGSPTITFAEVGATGDTITRSHGSWITDGFKVGDSFVVAGTVSNDGTYTIKTLSALVITIEDDEDLVAEEIASHLIDIDQSQTLAAHVAAQDAEFEAIDDSPRIDLSYGRGWKLSPIHGWKLRRPAAWAASLREYAKGGDVHLTTWWKAKGSLDGWDLTDGNGNITEYDERTVGGALGARFTCLRTWANGPSGAFVAMSLTRATEGANLSFTHNMAVTNLACNVCQAETENAIGQVLQLKADGTATETSLAALEGRVTSGLKLQLFQDNGNGPRCSSVKWTASRTDVLVPGSTLNGVLELGLNGTIEKIATVVKVSTVQAGG